MFEITPDGTETVLYAFLGGNDGWSPNGALIFDAAGNLYGTTATGGTGGCGGNGCGTAFSIAPDGAETVVSDFASGGPNVPRGGVIMDEQGNLFGTTGGNGSAYCGTVFKIARGRQAKAIYSFTCGKDGASPAAGLLQDANGVLYGTTERGGKYKKGTVFAVQK